MTIYENRLLQTAQEAYRSDSTAEVDTKRLRAITDVYSTMKKYGLGVGLKEAKDWVEAHWEEIAPDVHVTLYNEDESMTEQGRQVYMRAERDIGHILERMTRLGEVTVNEAVAILHSAVSVSGSRLILENRRKARSSKP